jgi:hypothetical protein
VADPTFGPSEAIRRGRLGRFVRKYAAKEGEIQITLEQLVAAVKAFILDNSQGGKRAQGVVAGLMDVFAGAERVESGRINDPSRKYPGDVCIKSAGDDEDWDKASEARDKPVSALDVQIFRNKCLGMGVREAAVVMVADKQAQLDAQSMSAWASERGLSLSFFTAGRASSIRLYFGPIF